MCDVVLYLARRQTVAGLDPPGEWRGREERGGARRIIGGRQIICHEHRLGGICVVVAGLLATYRLRLAREKRRG